MPATAPWIEGFVAPVSKGIMRESHLGMDCCAGRAALSPHVLLFMAPPHVLQLSTFFFHLLGTETAQLSQGWLWPAGKDVLKLRWEVAVLSSLVFGMHLIASWAPILDDVSKHVFFILPLMKPQVSCLKGAAAAVLSAPTAKSQHPPEVLCGPSWVKNTCKDEFEP